MPRRSRVSYATPHDHHAIANQVTMRDFRRHLMNDHDAPVTVSAYNFNELNIAHKQAHRGAAPDFVELPMNAKPEF